MQVEQDFAPKWEKWRTRMKDINPYLSICIPTYNRSEVLKESLMQLLKYEGDDIEVVISDNCSPDNTEEVVRGAADKRVRYYRNNYNNGGYNLISVLQHAQGKWAMLVSDEDSVYIENLKKIVALLKKNESCGMVCASYYLYGNPYRVYEDERKMAGFEAVNRILFHTYMSGKIFNLDYVQREIGDLSEDEIKERYGIEYCWLELGHLLLSENDLITSSIVIANHRLQAYTDRTYANPYTPEGRAREAIDFLKNTNFPNFSKSDKCKLFFRILNWGVREATQGYAELVAEEHEAKKFDFTDKTALPDFERAASEVSEKIVNAAIQLGYIQKEEIYEAIEYEEFKANVVNYIQKATEGCKNLI